MFAVAARRLAIPPDYPPSRRIAWQETERSRLSRRRLLRYRPLLVSSGSATPSLQGVPCRVCRKAGCPPGCPGLGGAEPVARPELPPRQSAGAEPPRAAPEPFSDRG